MINPNYIADRTLQVGFDFPLDGHHYNQANCKLTNKTNIIEIGNEAKCIEKILKEMAIIYVRFRNQYKFNYQTVL